MLLEPIDRQHGMTLGTSTDAEVESAGSPKSCMKLHGLVDVADTASPIC